MKIVNYIYTILLIAGLSLLGACQDFLDTIPDNRTEVDTEKKITALLVSAYPQTLPLLINEMASDNVMDNGTLYSVYHQEEEDAYLWKEIQNTKNEDNPAQIWEECYRAIAAANLVLESIAEMPDTTSLNAQKAEALLCRAYNHFILVNMFCQHYNTETSETDLGIPYVTKTETEIFIEYERGTVAEVYKKINADIETALPLVDDNLYTIPKYHFNSAAAYAFATRFNLYYLNYDKVIDYATFVIGENASSKLRNYTPLVNAVGIDDYANQFIATDEPANLMLLPLVSTYGYVYGPYSPGKRFGHAREICESETYWSDGNWSSSNWVFRSLYGFDQKFSSAKLITYFEYSDKAAGIGNAHVVNTAFTIDETLLCRAEAYAFNGRFGDAASDLSAWVNSHTTSNTTISRNQINNFYSLNNLPYAKVNVETVSDRSIKKKLNPKGFTIEEDSELERFLQCILYYRRIETLFEGLRWYDIKRYGIEYSHNRANRENDILTVDDPRRAFQIPDDAITAGLTPNPR